ncbi:MAG TPA: glyceraldehyde 3-phosphate dehydrogenase NAD-binding domain-containing protein [bacterium]|nr:glyceraldehyde 3-phosphate dehydrogenase NAD-binding domain-containing protein [bacterium]HQN72040.1 glyceraldehyde 3-phosphate dehydrogenase NAD-binding domain-containing protein [bacterium]HQO90998.1 glyceraldehyde 3-phosphate dehydrogenase NAD-binding domain-containing protein [bacterium]
MIQMNFKNAIGINGLGRIGKLTLWNLILSDDFDKIVINIGREAGKSLSDLIDYVKNDSTYGSLESFLFGYKGKENIEITDDENGETVFFGKKVKFLRKERSPEKISWDREGVSIVIDTTGKFTDPSEDPSSPGNLRGHIISGAKKVVLSAPFKFKGKNKVMPDDSVMLVYGINHQSFNPSKHHVISAASCTTTALAHMIKPLLDHEETSSILTASMSTIHSMTNSQSVLDSVPSSGTSDLRKNRAAGNNIILSTTGAAKALEYILPEMKNIGFMADSVRVPVMTVSLINLNLTFNSPLDSNGFPSISREVINRIYKDAAEGKYYDLIHFSQRQNVSGDLKGKLSAVVIESNDTHTRTGFIDIPPLSNVPVTHAKIFGWYDNEMGSYVNSLCRLVSYISKSI